MKANLEVIDAEPLGQDCTAKLEAALEMARNGELSSVAIAVVYRDGSPEFLWSDAPNASTLLGAIRRLETKIIQTCEDD